MNIREAYTQSLQQLGHEPDAAQHALVTRLATLQRALEKAHHVPRNFLDRWFSSGEGPSEVVKGIYIWGGVGRGKTYLMDMFYETLSVAAKRRVHFHRMMRDVHERLTALGDVEDPLACIAADLAIETKVLCFDEFFVSDIGDAMILGRLLDALFARGVTLVATSNMPPDDLYRDGLQRQQFLPAIELLKQHTEVVHIGDGIDYRLRLLERAGTYLTPNDAAAEKRLAEFFEESASSHVLAGHGLDVNGRRIRTIRCAKGIAWFGFDTLCGSARSQNDYIELARWYPAIIVSDVPALGAHNDDQARRFIALVDEFYDRRVKLIVCAAVELEDLYAGQRLKFEFERTASRLIEMQSTAYLAAPHLS